MPGNRCDRPGIAFSVTLLLSRALWVALFSPFSFLLQDRVTVRSKLASLINSGPEYAPSFLRLALIKSQTGS